MTPGSSRASWNVCLDVSNRPQPKPTTRPGPKTLLPHSAAAETQGRKKKSPPPQNGARTEQRMLARRASCLCRCWLLCCRRRKATPIQAPASPPEKSRIVNPLAWVGTKTARAFIWRWLSHHARPWMQQRSKPGDPPRRRVSTGRAWAKDAGTAFQGCRLQVHYLTETRIPVRQPREPTFPVFPLPSVWTAPRAWAKMAGAPPYGVANANV